MKQTENEMVSDTGSEEIGRILDEYNKLEPEEQAEAFIALQSFRGPLPHPAILRQYNELSPGAADSIINDFLDESKHRRSLELKTLDYASTDFRSGQTRGFKIAILAICSGFVVIIAAIIRGSGAVGVISALAGTILSGGSIVALVGKFTGNKAKKDISSGEEET